MLGCEQNACHKEGADCAKTVNLRLNQTVV